MLENGGLFVSGYDYKYIKDDNLIYVVKRMFDNFDSYKYELDDVLDVLYEKLLEISIVIEDIKNFKDYFYINFKEFKKLIDSIIDDYGYMVDGFLNEYFNRVLKKGF